jgi:hypothetical protein
MSPPLFGAGMNEDRTLASATSVGRVGIIFGGNTSANLGVVNTYYLLTPPGTNVGYYRMLQDYSGWGRSVCGDLAIDYKEECDTLDYGCDATCHQVSGYACVSPYQCHALCGDNLVKLPEECDFVGYGCLQCQAAPGYASCTRSCSDFTLFPTFSFFPLFN